MYSNIHGLKSRHRWEIRQAQCHAANLHIVKEGETNNSLQICQNCNKKQRHVDNYLQHFTTSWKSEMENLSVYRLPYNGYIMTPALLAWSLLMITSSQKPRPCFAQKSGACEVRSTCSREGPCMDQNEGTKFVLRPFLHNLTERSWWMNASFGICSGLCGPSSYCLLMLRPFLA